LFSRLDFLKQKAQIGPAGPSRCGHILTATPLLKKTGVFVLAQARQIISTKRNNFTISKSIAELQIPSYFKFMETLPKNDSGKILKST
jgi:acyl-CoA synthetase (AMP-forming)/AMP-acid ligase II